MTEKRWCAADVSALTGITHQTIRKYMRGECASISLTKAMEIADALDIPASQIIVRE